MKILREHINEKFQEDSDPIDDLNIGRKHFIKLWLEYYSIKTLVARQTDFKNKCVINKDLTIDVNGSISLNSAGIFKLPYYIKFRNVHGDFMINHNNLENLIGCPDYVKGSFYINGNPLKSLEGFPATIGGLLIISKTAHITQHQLRKVYKKTKIHWTTERPEDIYKIKIDYYKDDRPGKIEDYVFDL